ncbi:MAG: DNRLRE domain-containing protein [Chloroflexi bacterium]|nr:DNRLRE domain-containing protein [Chloroflexota bacterium]
MNGALKRFVGLMVLACALVILLAPGVSARPDPLVGRRDGLRGAGGIDPTAPVEPAEMLALGQIVLQPGTAYPGILQDARIMEWYPTQNGGHDGALQIQAPTGAIRTLMRWDLSVLAGKEINSARLGLYAFYRSQSAGTWAFDIAVYRVLVPWAEGSVTWNEASEGMAWGAAGCDQLGVDRDAIPIDSLHFTQESGVYAWYEWDITELAREWVEHPEENHGLILIATGSRVRYDFWAAEASAPTLRPKLIVEYSEEEPTPTPSLTPTTTLTPTASRYMTPTPTELPSATPTATRPTTDWIDISKAVNACCLPGQGCVFSGNTTGKPSNADYYGNGNPPWPYTGGEDVYILRKTVVGDLELRLDYWSGDFDIFLLYEPHPAALLAYGDRGLTYRNLAPGTYYIVVDGYQGSRGAYTLNMICSGEPTPTPTLTFTPSPTWTPSPTNTRAFSYYPLLYRQPTPTSTATATPTATLIPSPTPTFSAFDIAVNCGSDKGYTASDGYYYQPDQPYAPGGWGFWDAEGCGHCVYSVKSGIEGTDDDPLYQTYRYAMETYTFTVPPGRYRVFLHFAEIFRFVSVGQRVFSVTLEGQTVLEDYDMLAAGLRMKAGVIVRDIDVQDDVLDIGFIKRSSEDFWPAVNAIRVSRVGG